MFGSKLFTDCSLSCVQGRYECVGTPARNCGPSPDSVSDRIFAEHTSTVCARQANIAHGLQQVNNTTESSSPCQATAAAERTGDSHISELSEAHGERLDDETASAAVPGDQAMAPVGAFHRSSNK